jgi:tRNA uridine 5-carboxymethylaminomethyl modification enzyme
MNEEKSDAPDKFWMLPLRLCIKVLSYDTLDVHDILREGFDRSPMFNVKY